MAQWLCHDDSTINIVLDIIIIIIIIGRTFTDIIIIFFFNTPGSKDPRG